MRSISIVNLQESVMCGRTSKPVEPAHLLGIRGVFIKNGWDAGFFDFPLTKSRRIENLVTSILLKKPEAVAVSLIANSPKTEDVKARFIRELRGFGIKVIIGGPEVTDDVAKAISTYRPDVAIVGPGELPCEYIAKTGFDMKNLKESPLFLTEIEGVVVLEANNTNLPKDILTGLNYERDYDLSYYNREAWFRTNMGCGGRCIICPPGGIARFRPPKEVVDELHYLVEEKGALQLTYMGRDFAFNVHHANEIVKGIIDDNSLSGVILSLEGRVDSLWRAMTLAPEVWTALNQKIFLELNVGYESTLAHRRLRLGKASSIGTASKQEQYIKEMMAAQGKIRIPRLWCQLIPFDPDSTQEETLQEFKGIKSLMETFFPRFIPVVGSLPNRLAFYPGIRAAEIYQGIDELNPVSYFRRDPLVSVAYQYVLKAWETRDSQFLCDVLKQSANNSEALVYAYMYVITQYINGMINIYENYKKLDETQRLNILLQIYSGNFNWIEQ